MGQIITPIQATVNVVTIPGGASLSDVAGLGVQRLAQIIMPAGWDAAVLSFQASSDGNAWADLYMPDVGFVEYTVQAAASRAIIMPLAAFIGVRYLKVRSGMSAAPVNQTASRSLKLVAQ